MAFQLWYLSSSLFAKGDEGTSSSSGGDQLWLVLASAICDLVVVGITAVKMLYDFKELVKAIRRRETTFHKLRDQRAAMAGGASFTVHGAEAIERCHDGCSSLGAQTPGGGVAPVPERLLLSEEDFEVFHETDKRFWDDTGAARTTDEGRTPLGVGRLGPTLLIGEAATSDDDDGAFV